MGVVYFHIDMNAFFVSAEILLDPSLKGKPVAVSGTTRRSVISTSSYEARAMGVHSAQPIGEALKFCPELIVIPGHRSYYLELSEKFMSIVKEYASEVEQASIDECYADVTETISHFKRPLDLAVLIQKRIHDEVGLPCSIGVGPNMFLAKMASDMKKPMGITVLRIRDVQEKLWPLPISDMRGVGKKTEPLLIKLGIHKIGDLAAFHDKAKLETVFGRNTEAMIRRAYGHDDRVIVKEWDAKSMGVSETMLDDITDYEELRGIYRVLARKLSKRLKSDNKLGTTIQIRIKYFDFRNVDRSIRLEHPTWRSEEILDKAMELFDENWDGEAVRLAGISMTGLRDRSACVSQLDLFSTDLEEHEDTSSVLKDLKRQLPNGFFCRASDLLKGKTCS